VQATGAKRAFDVSATLEAPLTNFVVDHIAIEAQSAGSVADARDWALSHVAIHTEDGSQLIFRDTSGLKLTDTLGIATAPSE
jgi:hypothetical protein